MQPKPLPAASWRAPVSRHTQPAQVVSKIQFRNRSELPKIAGGPNLATLTLGAITLAAHGKSVMAMAGMRTARLIWTGLSLAFRLPWVSLAGTAPWPARVKGMSR